MSPQSNQPPQAAGISWRPSGGGDASNWPEVMAIVGRVRAPVPIWLMEPGGAYTIPAAAEPYQMHGSWLQAPFGAPQNQVVIAADGVQLLDLSRMEGGLILQGNNTALPLLTFSPLPIGTPQVFLTQYASLLQNQGTVPLIEVEDGGFFVFGGLFGGGNTAGSPTGRLLRLGAGANLLVTVNNGINLEPDSIIGAAPSFWAIQSDGSIDYFQSVATQSLFTGTVLNAPIAKQGGAGPTSFRPTPFISPLPQGLTYVDTTIVPPRPIYWDGAIWTDASGAPA